MFHWEAFSKTLLRDLARAAGLRVTFAVEDLAATYGTPPDLRIVDDLWPVLRDRWLGGTPASRETVVRALRARALGNKDTRISTKTGQMDYLASCRLSPNLRAIVHDAFVTAGSQETGEAAHDAVAPAASVQTSTPAPPSVARPQSRTLLPARPMAIAGPDVGLRAVEMLYKQLMIDDVWAVRRPRGFTWWSYRLAQHVEAGEPIAADDGAVGCAIRIWTEVVTGIPKGGREGLIDMIGVANVHESMSVVVWDDDAGTINECATSTVYDDTIDTWTPVLGTAALIQNTAAHTRAHALADIAGGQPAATDHPTSGQRPFMDDLLNGPEAWAKEAGAQPSKFAGARMLALKDFAPNWTLLATGDDTGLSAEVEFTDATPAVALPSERGQQRLGTALITVATDQPHPAIGTGALVLLRLPLTVDETQAGTISNSLNLLESHGESPCKLIGAWCAQNTTLCFVSFIPTILARPGLLENLLVDAIVRVHWSRTVLT